MSDTPPKKIGELNGKYALLFKAALWAFPITVLAICSWGGWVTVETWKNHEFRAQGRRVTQTHLEAELAASRAQMRATVQNEDLRPINSKLDRVVEAQTLILQNLTRVETKLEFMDRRAADSVTLGPVPKEAQP